MKILREQGAGTEGHKDKKNLVMYFTPFAGSPCSLFSTCLTGRDVLVQMKMLNCFSAYGSRNKNESTKIPVIKEDGCVVVFVCLSRLQ